MGAATGCCLPINEEIMKKTTERKRLMRCKKDIDLMLMHNLISGGDWTKIKAILKRAMKKL